MDQRQAGVGAERTNYPKPAMRRFRVYAFDPLASTFVESAEFNGAVISVPWEEVWEEQLGVGPSGEYLEVVDFDPASGRFYAPVDPNDPLLLAQDGLPPSEGRPQFHQQMVYAVAMRTIRNFERAMGRKVLWSSKVDPDNKGHPAYVQKLRLYPHALRHYNAYYSPQKKAVLFGYFQAKAQDGVLSLPGGWVFTCLSHDIIAHEITHAILDGAHSRFIERSGFDAPAFHEAFADIVALLQHFTMREVVQSQLTRHRGSLRFRTLLTGLARQFGDARGMGGALREALDGAEDQAAPVAGNYSRIAEPHARGSHLVAAVFDAFVTIFERRSADLLRLASASARPDAELHPDLVRRLAQEATKSADHMLRICVRALDYMPPVDPRFGEFLRSMITADADLVPDDPLCYRVAIAAAFRRRGIFPDGIASMAPDSLLWEHPEDSDPDTVDCNFDRGIGVDVDPLFNRKDIWRQARENRDAVQFWLDHPTKEDLLWEKRLGIALTSVTHANGLRTVPLGEDGLPNLEVHSVRVARRAGPDGQDLRQLIIEVTQERRAFYSSDEQDKADWGLEGARSDQDFWFRGGATLVVDLRDEDVHDAISRDQDDLPGNGDRRVWKIRYAIRKRIDDKERLQAQRDYATGIAEAAMKSADSSVYGEPVEPVAMLHGI